MTVRKLLLGTVMAAPFLVATSVSAQEGEFMLEEVEEKEPTPVYTSEVEAGVGYSEEDSFKFGEYTGLEDEPFAIGNVLIRRRDAYDDQGTRYWELIGTDLGLDSRSVHAEYGQQGKYAVFASYDQIPHRKFDDGATPFLGAGSGNLTLPSGWVAATSTQAMTNLIPSLRGLDIETERQRAGGGFEVHRGGWTLQGSFEHEDKDGLDTIGMSFATNGGNTAAMILPEPIDYQTNRFNVSLGYAGKRAQFELGYELSLFSDDTSSLTFRNPFSAQPSGAPWAAAARFPTGVGQASLPPDNHAHHVTFSGGYNLWRATRVMFNAAYSRYEQDENFLPISGNPLLTVNTPLPRSSLEGEIDNLLFNVALSSRPMRKVDVRASYRYDERDNDTPQDVFVRIAGDAQNQPAGIANANARINLPYSFQQHKAEIDVGYRVLPRTKVSAGYEFDQRHRDFQEVNTTREHTVRGKVRSTPLPWLSGWVQYARGDREGSEYVDNQPFLDGHTQQFLNTPGTEQFENDPRLRKFWLADRDRDTFRGVLTLTPSEVVAVSLDGSYTADEFNDSPLGLQDRHRKSATVDVSFVPNDIVSTHAFFTYERLDYEQAGCSFDPFPPDPARQCIDSPPAAAFQWFADTEDDVYSAGFGAEWQANERLNVGVDYIFTKAITTIDVTGGSGLTVAGLPDIVSKRHTVGLRLDYKLRDQLSARLAYQYERFSSKDFAIDGIAPNTISEVITLGEGSPDYRAHVVGVSLVYRF